MSASARRAGVLVAASVAAVGAAAQTVTSQDPGSELYLDVSTGISSTDNYESLVEPAGNTTLWFTDLALSYDSETKYQSLSFRTGGRLEIGEFAEDPDNNGDWINSFATLDYARESSTALFGASLSYRERDNGIDVVDDFESSTDLIVDQGTRADTRALLTLETGVGTPVRTSSTLFYNERRYFDTTDEDLTDQNTLSFDGEVGLAITRTAELLLVGEYYDRDNLDDADDDETRTAVGIGISAQIAEDLSFRGVIKYERDETTELDGGSRRTKTEHSPTLDLSFAKERPNGTIRFSLGSELDSNGVRTTARIGRDLELKYGTLAFTVGTTWDEDGDLQPVGTVNWSREYKNRQIGLNYSSSVRTDDDGDQILANRLSFDFLQELTRSDRLQLQVNVSATEDLDGSDNDRRQAGVNISYFHDINRYWSLVTGYSHSYSEDSGDETITRNEVFARLDRRFSLRP